MTDGLAVEALERVEEAAAAGGRWKPHPAYKDSGIEWLGEIPAGWAVRRLKHLANLASGFAPPESFDRSAGEYPVFGSNGLIGYCNQYFVSRETLAVGRVGASGSVNLVPARSWVSDNALLLEIRSDIHLGWLHYSLKTMNLGLQAAKNAQPIITGTFLGNQALCAPPATEQRVIIGFLERETARINALVKKKERLIELLEEKRTALISHAVTKGLDLTVPMKECGIEWLGKVPQHWDVAPVYSRYEVALGKMLDAKRDKGKFPGRYVRNVDVQWDAVNTEDLPEMDFAPSERERYRLLPGDLLVCEGGEVGRTAIWRGDLEECFYQKAIHRLRPRLNSELPRFFYYVMYAMSRRGVFAAVGNPNTIDHLTGVQLRHYRFPFPPRREQESIARFLDRETERIDALIAKVREAIDRLKELRTALISAAVTGKIDVREEAA